MTTATQTQFKETDIGLIPEEWDVLPVYELAQWINGLAFKNIHFSPNGKPVIKINELKYGVTGQTQFTEDVFDENYHLHKNDLLFSWSGSPDTSIDAFWYDLPDGWLNQHIFKVKPKESVRSDFLYYIFKAYKQRFIEIARDKQTTGLGHVTLADIKRFYVALPSKDEQKKIAEILSSLDDKIELNRKINANLEKLANSLFKRWFVDIGDELSKGWEVKSLDEIADFLNGLALQKYPAESEADYLPVIKIRELNNGITDTTDKASTKIPSEYILKNGDIIFSWSGSLDVVIWCSGRGALNQHLFKVTSDRYPKWFYYQWLKYFLPNFQSIASDKAVTMGHIKRGHLTESKVLVPDSQTLSKMDELMSSIIETVINNSVEIQNLIGLRDSLLPRLMTGKIRVKK